MNSLTRRVQCECEIAKQRCTCPKFLWSLFVFMFYWLTIGHRCHKTWPWGYKLEYSPKLKIKRNDWLLADTCNRTGLSPPVKYLTDRSKAVLLLWIFNVFVLSCVCYVFVHVCLYVLCGHLLGKGWPLGSRLWCLTVSLSLSHWYPGSGMVLDCIDSWSLHPYLLCQL